MPDQGDSRPPPALDLDNALRATYAHQLRPEEQDMLRTLCASVLLLAHESGMVYPGDEPLTVRELGAVATDLRQIQSYLAFVGDDPDRITSRREVRACDQAYRLSADVGAIAASLEETVAAW